MSYIIWTQEEGRPRVLAVMDTVFASTGVTHRNTYEEFEAIVGRPKPRRRSGVTAESKIGLESWLEGGRSATLPLDQNVAQQAVAIEHSYQRLTWLGRSFTAATFNPKGIG